MGFGEKIDELLSFSFSTLDLLQENLEPVHWVVEILLVVFIVYLLLHKKGHKGKERKLSEKEKQMMIDEFYCEPLVPDLTDRHLLDLSSQITFDHGSIFPLAQIQGKEAYNLTTGSYLGYLNHPKFRQESVAALKKYGTGSCGPRGFLGTVDVHLELEKHIQEFMGTADAIIYSSQYSTVVSFVMAMAARYDVIVVDKGVKHAVKMGVDLSRAKTYWFEHNDIQDLTRIWESLEKDRASNKIPPNTRFWLLVEGLYENHGDICPLPEIMKLKERHKFRVMIEESHSIGVLGETGRGVTEHFGIPPTSVECIIGSMNTVLSADGGFCTGEKELVDFQRLNGSGYVFSASLPPCLTVGADVALSVLGSEEGIRDIKRLREVVVRFRELLDEGVKPWGMWVEGEGKLSPIFHLRLLKEKKEEGKEGRGEEEDLEDDKVLQAICDAALEKGALISRAKYINEWQGRPEPSIRICVNATMTDEEIAKITTTIIQSVQTATASE